MKAFIRFISLLCLILTGEPAAAETLTREEALKAAFPGAEIRASMVFLTEAEQQEAGRLAEIPVDSALVARYDAVVNEKLMGRAYVDTHVVRTKKESLLIILSPDGHLKRIEIIAFLEPPEYIPPDRWYRQFDGKELNGDLYLKKSIHPVTGATLTARSTLSAVRRILAVDQVLEKRKKDVSK